MRIKMFAAVLVVAGPFVAYHHTNAHYHTDRHHSNKSASGHAGAIVKTASTPGNAATILQGIVTTLAGKANVIKASTDGVGAGARFWGPVSLAVDASGTMYVVDGGSGIRKISPEGSVQGDKAAIYRMNLYPELPY